MKRFAFILIFFAFMTVCAEAQKDTALLKGREVWYEPAPKGMVFVPQGIRVNLTSSLHISA
jgi:hypothetical protein